MNTIYFRKLKKFWSMTLAFLMALFMVNEGASQTNPPLYNGWPTNYTFASWNDTEPANTFPANMRFWRTGTQDPTLLATANADYTLAYNLTTGSRINGLGANGFSFINTGTSGNLGMAVLGLNLSGRQNVQVSWTGGTVVANPRVYRIRLQYRIGASGTWTDVPGPIEYESNATAGHSQNFGPTTLPTAVENESEVYLRWFYYYVSGTGARPQLRIDDITVSSSVSSAPSIVASASSITAPSYVFASSPTSTSFTIDGSNLTGNPTITAPTNFQVSLDNSTFSTNVNVPVSAGTFSPNPRNIFVRLAPGLSPFIYNGTLTITGGGISSPIDISLTGEVTGSNVIAEWNFEPPTLTNPASPEPSIGTGTAAFTGATYLAAGGVDPTTGFCSWTNSGSAWAFSPVTPADARFDFFTSTSNFSNIVLTFDMRFSNAAPRTVQVQYTTNGGTTWNNFSPTELNIYRFCNTRGGIDGTKFDVSNPLGSAAGDARLRLSLNLSAITAVNNNPQFGVRFLPATYQSTGDFRQANNVSNISTGGALRLDNILFSGTCSTPVVLANLTNLSNFSYLEGFGPSAAQSFVVQGNCLSGNVTVTAPTNFEVSTNVSSGYGSSINLTAVSGVLNPTTLYVRLISGLSASTTPYTGNISITSPSATTFNIALTGIVNSLPGAGNIVVVRADAAGSNNTTGTFLELEPSTASQTNPQNIFFIDGVGSASPTRFSGSATSTMYLSNSNDRSELYVTGAASNNPTGNTNTVLQRRVVRLNASSTLSSATTYTSASGQQPRSATSLNNTNMIIGDQNGTYTNSATSPSLSVNIRSVKAFGGIVYGLRASATEPAVNTVSTPTPNTVTGLPGIPNLNTAQDFVLISSGFNGATFDVLYILRSTSATAGNIDKYSLVSGTWIANGTYSTGIGGFGLTGTKFLVGAELYVTSGTGSTAANIVRRLEDANGYNQPINITSTVDLYTTAAGTTLKGVAFAPVATNAPVVNVTSTFIDNFNYTALPGPGGPSASQSFNVTGANLTDDVTITAPADFEVSLDNVNFFNSLTLTRSGTTLAGQPVTVRVRLKTGLTANTYLQALTLSTAGGINKFVNVRGVVIDPVPTVTVNASLINFTTFRNLASAAQTYTVSGQFLDGNISIASPAGYEHRVVGNPTFTTAPLTLVQTGGNVALTTIEIRLASGAIAVRNGNINITSLNSNNPTVAITGEVMPRVQISEIHYNPDDSQGFTDDNYEFIEFRNFENITVDISGYNVLGIEYTLPGTAGSVTIPANERIVLARNPASYSAVVPAARLFGWTGTGALSNSGETIALRTTQNNTVNSVTYGVAFPWANGANGNGPSLELVNQSTIDNNGNPYNWCAIGPNNGTPGASNTCGVTYYSTAPGVITDAIWALDPSTPALPTFPGFSSFSDVVVRHIVELNPTNTQTVRNLIINSTGRLWRNVSINSTDTTESSNEIRYINVHGSDVIVNGVLGNPNVNIIDLLGINLNGGTKTISGTGTINIGRIRKNSDNNTTVLNINANVRLGFNGTVMYNNHSGTASRFEVTLQAGRTLRTLHPAGGLSIDGTVGTAAGQRGGSYTINGTAIVGRFWHRENRGFNIDPTPNPGGVQTTIGSTGRLNVKDIFMQTSRVNSTNITTPFTINAGGRLTITDDGTLTLWSGDFNTNGGLFVNEGGAILHGNETPGTIPLSDPDRVTPNIIGTATIRRTGSPTVNNNKYNYWSSPVENVTLNTVVNAAFNPANSINNLYIYNPTLPAGSSSQQLLEGWVNVPPSTVMQAARGYITTGVNTVSFTGALHNNNYNFPLQGGSFIRMNLVGNPYPSAISAAEFLNVNGPSGNNRIENTVWFWTDDGSTGGDYAADDYVAFNGLVSVNGVASKRLQFDASGRNINVAQGFVVSATASGVGQNLVFNNTMRRPASGTPFFSTDEVSRFHFTLRNQNNLESEIAVCFREDLTDHFDAHFDSRKMFGNSNIALYTMVNGEPMMIDGYGEHNAHRVIDLGVTAKLAGQHTIEINRIENMDPSVLVFIENIATGEFHNLRNGAFTFNSTGNMTGVHFRLHFREPVTVNAVQESCEQTGGKIEINTPYSGWAYSVRNNEGMVIAMDNNPTAQSIINHVDAGDYTVVLTYTDGYSFEKYVTIEPVVPVNATVEFSATQVSLGAAIIEVMVNSDNATFMSVNMGDGTIYNGMNLVSHAYDQIGTYNVIITVNNEFCTSTYSAVVNVTAPVTTGINNLESNQIAVFPNPAKETANVLINLQSNEGNLTMNITDVNGKVVISRQISSQAGLFNEVIDIRNLDSGVYQISVQGAKFNAVKKLVVAK